MALKLKITLLVICLCLIALFTLFGMYTAPSGEQATSWAGVESQAQKPPTEGSNGTSWFMIKSLAVMGVMFILMFSFVKGSRNYFYGRRKGDDPLSIQIRGSKMLGPKKSLYYVEALGHILLLGATEKEISVLLDVPWEQLSSEQQNLWRNNHQAPDPGFKNMVSTLLKQGRS